MYRSGACSKPPRSLAASTTMAFGAPVAQRFVPSSGSTAMSTCGKCALGAWVARPTFSPIYSMGASSRSPSPMTIVPSICTVSMVLRIASTVISSALWPSPKPMVRAAAIAAVSTTRKNSRLSCASMDGAPFCPSRTRSALMIGQRYVTVDSCADFGYVGCANSYINAAMPVMRSPITSL